MKLWAGGKYLLLVPGRGPACGTANGARTNNVRKLLITDLTLTNDIRFLYFPPFATPGLVPLLCNARFSAVTAQRQNLGSAWVSLPESSPRAWEGRALALMHEEVSIVENGFFKKGIYSKK